MTALSPILLSLYLDGFLWWKLLDSHGNLVPFFSADHYLWMWSALFTDSKFKNRFKGCRVGATWGVAENANPIAGYSG